MATATLENPFPSALQSLPHASSGDSSLAISCVIAAQRQLAEVVAQLSDADYTKRPVGTIASSIGGHVRHCLDHVDSLLQGACSGHLDYDHRRRDPEVEQHRLSALAAIERQERQLRLLAGRHQEEKLQLTTSPTGDGTALRITSCLARELAFLLSHTVHHSALIRVMVELLGGKVPKYFGYAPATIAHLERMSCAR